MYVKKKNPTAIFTTLCKKPNLDIPTSKDFIEHQKLDIKKTPCLFVIPVVLVGKIHTTKMISHIR